MDRLANVATPAAAARDVAPESEPEPGLAPMATATLAVEVVRLPPRSRIWTFTPPAPPLMAVPATVVVGWALNESWAGGPTGMSKPAEVAPVGPVPGAAGV